MIPDATIWNACAEVFTGKKEPIEVRRVAEAAGMSEEAVIAALIRSAVAPRMIEFRYPPIPRAAITNMIGPRA